MEIKNATVSRGEAETSLLLGFVTPPLKIVLTDDNPNNVKTVFNSVLKELKNGIFEFELEDNVQDLYHHICTEYIIQLNLEMKAVYQELLDYGLVNICEEVEEERAIEETKDEATGAGNLS
ncbi:hypothetical protein [Mucilaginibacter lappiensis]|uniref:Uncharacterized protein n=1 Tax=Mucilaginibacter lappiensis TaxID=354630 RepID=A0A841JPK8_9SPHI|nr:hypothetical protein [Mucilaginibacter lappiensis]MBB6131536.1 hypothetical protein [Mucilaginibacter lappiensis]